ncbi:hypothetical protein [Rubritalea marina]|uniref:hypothetical protein n=1 Tax=Rubritalea marina TaxID=361055 RepID=UPI0012E9E032|nr:hypothetical protein [Rubritalea marina]
MFKIILILLLAGFAAVLFMDFSDPTLPTSPESVSIPGRYMIDDHRFVEVRQHGKDFVYYEGKLDSPAIGSRMINNSKHKRTRLDTIQLGTSWTLSLVPPETIVITTSSSGTLRRRFGTSSSHDSKPKSLIRRSPKALPLPTH